MCTLTSIAIPPKSRRGIQTIFEFLNMKNIIFGCRFVSFLMFLTLILNWKVPVIQFHAGLQQSNIAIGWLAILIITGVLFIILNLIAAVGLFFLKKWSFSICYVAIIFSTIFFSISYVPLVSVVSNFFLPKSPGILLINIIILIYVIYLNILYLRSYDRHEE